jgi:antitoxin component of MazEF toxin-antitoxin module
MKLETRIKKIGNNFGIIIPGSAVLGTGLCEGDILEIHVKEGNIIIISNLEVLDFPDLYSKIIEDFFKVAEENKMDPR